MTADIQTEIVKLSEEWHDLISGDHHKDNGYITDDIEIACDSYETALMELRTILKRAIEREKESKKLPKYNDW